jgi:hypothetical protein
MKNIKVLTIISLIISSFYLMKCSKGINKDISLGTGKNLDTITLSHSMKGWELYSWQHGNAWHYSILMGTNRAKSCEEITANPITVLGKDSLKMLLDKLPENENVFWEGKSWLTGCGNSNYGSLYLPDEATVNDVSVFCTQKKLILNIAK